MKKLTLLIAITFTFFANAQTPDWNWAKSVGGTSYDYGKSCATDANGNIFVTGTFNSTSITFGTITLSNAGGEDMFIVKYDKNGTVLWAKSAGGPDPDQGNSCSTDANGNIIVTGYFQSFSIVFGTTTMYNSGGKDIFITKYDPDGNVLWAKNKGGAGDDFGFSCSTDANGFIFVSGSFQSSSIIFGTATLNCAGVSDMFIVKCDENGNVLWAKSAGGTGEEKGNSCSTDASGNILVLGTYSSPSITFGTNLLTNVDSTEGTSDIFIVKYDENGNVLWAKSAGGTSYDYGNNCTVDLNGNIIVIGSFESFYINFGTNSLFNVDSIGNTADIFIVKYDGNGNVLWAKSPGGTSVDVGNSCSIEASGNIIVTGDFSSSSIAFGTTILTNAENSEMYSDVFVVKYDENGNILWAKSAGGTSYDNGMGCSSDANGNISVTGLFYSSSITFGNNTLNKTGTANMFIAHLSSVPPPDSFPKNSWTKMNSGTNIILRSVYFTDHLHGVAVGDFGTIIKTDDAGHNWKTISGVTTDHLLSVSFVKPDIGWACGVNGDVFKTNDGGTTWVSAGTGFTNSLFSIQFINDLTGFAVGENGIILKTTDAGLSWSSKTSGTTDWLFSVYFINETTGFAVGDQQTVLKTANGGETWTTTHFVPASLGVSNVFFADENKGWAVGYNGTILKTVNGGNSWSDISYQSNFGFNSVHFPDTLNGWIAGNSPSNEGIIMHTDDGGITWQYDETPLPTPPLRFIYFINENEGYAVGENGVVLKTLKGLQTETVIAPVVGDTIHLDTAGVRLVFNNLYSTLPLDSVSLSVHYFPEEIPVSSYNDSIATIFNNSYWQAIAVNVDSFSANVCFYFNPADFNTTYLQYLSCLYQEFSEEPWNLINAVPEIDSNKICFITDHFSNWSLAITKSDARVKKDTILFNATGQTMLITKTAPDADLTMQFELQPGETDSVILRRYDMNPGGDLPLGINKLTETFWEVNRTLIDSTDIWIDVKNVKGYTDSDSGEYRILHRPDALTDWVEIPTYRVRRGMKEVLIVKNASARGHFIVGAGTDIMPVFSASVTTDSACAGDTIHFQSSVSGGIGPFQYIWEGDAGLGGGGEVISHVYSAMGVYNYSLSVEDSTGVVSVFDGTVIIDCVTGIEEGIDDRFFVYPNPVNHSKLNIVFKNSVTEKLKITVYDVYGRKIYQKSTIPAKEESQDEVSFSGVSPGLHLVKIEANGKIYLQKVVVR